MWDILSLVALLLSVSFLLGLPIAWMISEYYGRRWLRILLGTATLVCYVGIISFVYSLIIRLDYNNDYGLATENLIKTSIQQIEDGNLERVLKAWRGLDFNYQFTYENRAGYEELAEEAARLMKGEPVEPGSTWDVSRFNEETWLGHWEGDNGFWLVVGEGNPPDVAYSWYSPAEPKAISFSPDCGELGFTVLDTVLHKLTLQNKYEARHEWFDVSTNTMLGSQTVHKLVRASEE